MRTTATIEALLLALIALFLAAFGGAYAVATNHLDRTYDVPVAPFTMPDSAAVIDEGERLTRVRGCYWCHGDRLQGRKYFASAASGIIMVSPDLTARIREFTPAQFAHAVRHGIRPDGTSLQPAMPSFAFYNMSDDDLGAIMAYIASLPRQAGPEGRFELLPVGWLRWLRGGFSPQAATLIDHTAPRPPPFGDPVTRGRYLAESMCTECHSDAGRRHVPGSPDLIVASAYDLDSFRRLLRTGESRTGRELDFNMVEATRTRYALLTDDEIDALHAYFQSLVQ